MHSEQPILRVEGLGVQFGAFVALNDVNWSVDAGQVLGIIGPNGAGKSTCFDAVTNLVRRKGRVLLGGEDVTDLPANQLASKGLRRAFQQNAFFSHLTLLDNMIAVTQDGGGSSLAECLFQPFRQARRAREGREDAARRLVRMGIAPEYHDLLPGETSYGTQRQLSIALAFGGGARVLMLDEPAAGLGGEDMAELVRLLGSLRDEGVTIIIIEHHMDLIMSITDHIVVLDCGRLLASGSPTEIQQNPHVLEAYLGRDDD